MGFACRGEPALAGPARSPGGNPRPEQRRGQEPAFYLGVADVDVDAEFGGIAAAEHADNLSGKPGLIGEKRVRETGMRCSGDDVWCRRIRFQLVPHGCAPSWAAVTWPRPAAWASTGSSPAGRTMPVSS